MTQPVVPPAPTTGPPAPGPEATPPAVVPPVPGAPAPTPAVVPSQVASPAPAPAPAPVVTPPPAPAAPPAGEPAAPPAVDPARLETFPRSYVEELRGESAGYRTTAAAEKTAKETAIAERDAALARLAEFEKLVNPQAGQQPPDPAQVAAQAAADKAAQTAQSEADKAEIRRLTVANALPVAAAQYAAANGGRQLDLGLLNAVLSTNGTYTALDPTAATFQQDLVSKLTEAATANPGLVVQSIPAVQTTGTEPTGPSAATGQLTLEQYRQLSPDEAVKAQANGQLRTLLGG